MVKPLRSRIQEIYQSTDIPWYVIERDYLQSWILVGLSQMPLLLDTLVFKGGTALRKCYFGDYRFSEDLDFTGLNGVPTGSDMEHAVQEACSIAMRLMERYGSAADIICERYVESRPHPGNQEAFRIRARLPWHNSPLSSIMVEITVDEKILKPVKTREIIHQYGESLEAEIKTYSLEEIVAEKLRAILQNVAMLKRRGWNRTRGRDYYDLWRILSTYKDDMDFTEFISFLRDKCTERNVVFTGPEDFFDGDMLALVENNWDQSLEHLVPNLPASKSVIGELRTQITDLFA